MRNTSSIVLLTESSLRWTPDKERGKEMSGVPKCTKRLICANTGSPKRREPHGDGTPIVVTARK
jgi:hypothetical protein